MTFNMKDDEKNQVMISDFHEKMDNMKVILQFAQKIDIIKKTIAHKVYKTAAYSEIDTRFWINRRKYKR